MNTTTPIKVALTGNVALELLASYFRDAGYVVMPQDADMEAFQPDFVYDATSRDAVLVKEVAGFYDERMRELSGSPYSAAGLRAIVDEFAWSVASVRARALPKILAVDADNTLWKGILTEDGPDALEPCEVFQEGLAKLSESGVVLVLLSKNNEEEVMSYLGRRGRTVLPPEAFASIKVNWSPKAGNLVEACRELNLSTDSVVFVDDNPHERAQMKAHLPEVNVAPWSGWTDGRGFVLGGDERQLVRRLREYFFSNAGRTAEDRLRADDYRAAAARLDSLRRFASRDDYLDDLGLWVHPSLATEENLDRLAQMAAKTNQFNATTIRRSREEFAARLHSPDHRVFVFRAGDRFGEQGVVAYIVAERVCGDGRVPAPKSSWHLTDFVMSCRAMGRTLEHFALAYVAKALGEMPSVDFVPTAKNRPFADFRASLAAGLKSHFREV